MLNRKMVSWESMTVNPVGRMGQRTRWSKEVVKEIRGVEDLRAEEVDPRVNRHQDSRGSASGVGGHT